MVLLAGIYKFRPQPVAYRSDFCLTCAAPRLSFSVRSFYMLHLFYIPLLPLGFWRQWHCVSCNRDPHTHPGSSKTLNKALCLALAMFAAVAWFVPDPDQYTWIARLLLPLAFAVALWHTLRSRPDTSLRRLLRQVQPANETECAVCGGPLVIAEKWRCSMCDAERMVVS